MKPQIVRTDTYVRIAVRLLDKLQAVADVFTCRDDSEETILAAVSRADLILACYAPITGRIIRAAPKLKGIVKYGVGVDSIDLQTATSRNVWVANCPDYGSNTVADHAFALLIGLARKLTTIDRTMWGQGWAWPTEYCLGIDLAGKTLGVIGLGRIGRAMAKRAAGFDMNVVAYDPYVEEEAFRQHNVGRAPLEELLTSADFVTVHCVLTAETRGMLSAKQLRMMKPSAYLVNVSRGAIVDEQALISALEEGWIAGGGFDVFAEEPLTLRYPLARLENVILTPHLAWYTQEALERIDADTLEAVLDIFAGRPPRNLKNTDVLRGTALAAAK